MDDVGTFDSGLYTLDSDHDPDLAALLGRGLERATVEDGADGSSRRFSRSHKMRRRSWAIASNTPVVIQRWAC